MLRQVLSRATSGGDTCGNAATPTKPCFTDAFVAKLNPSGTALIYFTYLGGDG